jgi:hypothetical protein
MGQQQLLLIVLGVIIVGIAVVVGINLFNANAEESTKDSMVSEGTNLGALAQQYFKKPLALGGGGNSFLGFTDTKIPTNLRSTPNGSWVVQSNTANQWTILGTPQDIAYASSWDVLTTAERLTQGTNVIDTLYTVVRPK